MSEEYETGLLRAALRILAATAIVVVLVMFVIPNMGGGIQYAGMIL